MNIFSIIYLVNVFLEIKTEYEKIILNNKENIFYISITLGNKKNSEEFIFSTMLPINFFPSTECTICTNKLIEKNDKDFSFIKSNVSALYYYLNFSGDLYNTNITLGTQNESMNFIAFNQISEIDSYEGKGRYSLSFLNYDFNTVNKTFALYLESEQGELDLGGYDTYRIKNIESLRVFNISKTNYTSENIYNNFWYIDFNTFYINKAKLTGSSYKLTFDINTKNFYIPKDFFFKNSYLIFPEEAKCQVQPEGHFVCFCNEEYTEIFSKFKFVYENNDFIEIKPEDYILFDNSGSDNYCYVYIKLNYDNDYFIVGKYVMNNYYNIFDIDAGQLKLYPIIKKNDEFLKEKNFIIALIVLLTSIFLLLSCYLIYRKLFSRNNDENNDLNDDNFVREDWDFVNDEIQHLEQNNENSGQEQDNNNINNDNGYNNEGNQNNDNDNLIGNENSDNNIKNGEFKNSDEKNNNNDDNEIIYGGDESNIIN